MKFSVTLLGRFYGQTLKDLILNLLVPRAAELLSTDTEQWGLSETCLTESRCSSSSKYPWMWFLYKSTEIYTTY